MGRATVTREDISVSVWTPESEIKTAELVNRMRTSLLPDFEEFFKRQHNGRLQEYERAIIINFLMWAVTDGRDEPIAGELGAETSLETGSEDQESSSPTHS